MGARSMSGAVLVAGFTFGVLPVLGANPAYACSCVPTDEAQNVERADVVFKGTLDDSSAEVDGKGTTGAGTVIYTFAPSTTYKGSTTSPQQVSTSGSSASCGVNLDGAGPFLVFANNSRDGLAMSLCGGTRAIGADEEPTFAPAQPTDPVPSSPVPSESEAEAGAVGQAVSTVADHLRELLGTSTQ